MGERRSYTEEFKRDAVELSLNSDKSVKEIAEDLGINYGNLTRWRSVILQFNPVNFISLNQYKIAKNTP